MSEEKFLHLLKKKRGFFEAILELSEGEENLSLHEWISTLEQKEVLLSCIDEIDAQLAPFREALSHLSQEIDEELAATKKIMQQILHLDSINQSKRKRDLQS